MNIHGQARQNFVSDPKSPTSRDAKNAEDFGNEDFGVFTQSLGLPRAIGAGRNKGKTKY